VQHDDRPLVLHVIHHLVIGGMENGLVNLVNRMPPERFRHAIACVEDHSDFRDRIARPDVPVYALHRSRIGQWRLRAALYRLCRELRPTIVHTRNLSGLDALLPSRLAGVRSRVHGEHGWDVTDLHGDRARPMLLRRLHSPLVDRYVTVSRHLARYLVDRVGIDERRIVHVYNGVDTQRFVPAAAPRDRSLLPAAWRSEDVIVVGAVGRMQPVKDHATLVRAVAELHGGRPQVAARLRLAIVGDGPLLQATRTLARELGIADLAWFPGARSDIDRLLGCFDVFALTSLNEGISNTILEAMAAGLPVVASRVGGNVELVDDGGTGGLFAPGDVGALAGALAAYASDAALRTRHGEAARRSAVERFSIDRMVRSYQSLYDELCPGGVTHDASGRVPMFKPRNGERQWK
jgi:sugar transferase (PEP-CTERM/EpsH1 system associated)